ncbi:centrosomal protein of 70 kDa isoform X1 [Thamnophis elegans]|uniref:centrosomal protein of 70 kDa isoform X1 n=2 Tax=Thamnophis elegans TaxID=35005 RepID=UPI001378083A|nr:centrosomal protein of 70 kDa isoform X1 [Thamnophis elegans]XP_032071567.1 centrosomal protein of 70 kDa isoform X1 [Thamnophis elegans]
MTEQEQEWENLNKLLRQHGLRPVCLDTPGTCGNVPDAEKIVMDKQSSEAIQHALKTLLEETERQRKIIRDLIEDNHQLRDELRLERGRASRQEQRANDLDVIVENVKHKIRQLEDESIANASQQHNQIRDLQKDHEISQAVYRHQAKQLEEQEGTIDHLEKELSKLGLEEQQRIATQKKVFRQFCKQAPRTHVDQQICCLIDYYESQISHVRKELRKYKKEINHLQDEGKNEEEFLKNIDATANYKALLMSFQTQIIETKARNEQLVHENINLKKEMEIRPTVQELKFYKHQVKKLEKILKNIKSLESSEEENMKENKELTKDLGGSQLQEVCRRYLQVLSSIDSIIRSPRRAPLITLMQKKDLGKSWAEEERGFEHLPAVIETWADQLMALKILHYSLKKLLLRLVPRHSKAMQDTNEYIRVEDLQQIVEEISEEVGNEEKKSLIPSQQTLYAIVCHFQKLFDVKTLSGVYPRMNEVYTKLGEMINAMRNLCDLLELDCSAPPSVLVNTVGKLCNLFNENVAWQVEQLLGTQDIESIIFKLEEHDDFFPAFHALINNLLRVLEVRSLTEILPAVQKLKWMVQ